MNTRKAHEYALAVLVVLGIVLIYLCFLLARQYRQIHALNTEHTQLFHLAHRQQTPLTAQDVNNIAPWMTFDFITRIFHLPSAYLQNALQITDVKYPNISLGTYARAHAIDSASFLAHVQAEVAAYLNAQSSTQ